MVRRPPAMALFIATLLFSCPAWAQSLGQESAAPGFRYAGKWIGYTPAHLKHGSQEPPAQVPSPHTSAASAPDSGMAATGEESSRPARRSGPPPQTVQGARPPEPVDGAVVPASFRQMMPDELDGMMIDPGFESCGAMGDCGVAMPGPAMYCGFPRVWARTEYLLWWTSAMRVPPLVTTSPDGTVWEEAGVLGLAGTDILFGDDRLDLGGQSGGRISVGLWLDPARCRGLEASYIILGQGDERFAQSSDGDPILARPFFNTDPGEQDALVIAFDGVDLAGDPRALSGSILITANSRFQGGEVLFRRSLFQQCESRLDFLLGYEFHRLDDELRIEQEFTVEDDPIVVAGTTIELFDLFDARNDFHGAQLGVVFRERICRWSMELSMKLGLGNTRSQVTIDGLTTITAPLPAPGPTPEGLLARQSNIGVYEQDQFTMVPQLGLTLGYDIACGLRFTFGYDFIYWSKVARPGDQIDLNVFLPQQVAPPGDHPQFNWVTTDFWAQGMKFGLDYRY